MDPDRPLIMRIHLVKKGRKLVADSIEHFGEVDYTLKEASILAWDFEKRLAEACADRRSKEEVAACQ